MGDLDQRSLIIASNHLIKLQTLGWEIVAFGTIEEDLIEHGIMPCEIKRPKGFPRRLNGRPVPNSEIISGLLSNPENMKDNEKLFDHELGHFDIVYLNVTDSGSFVHHKNNPGINDIDVGMFTYLLSAVQNSEYVTVITDAKDLILVTKEIQEDGETSADTRAQLAMKAIQLMATNLKYIVDIAAHKAKPEGPIYFFGLRNSLASV